MDDVYRERQDPAVTVWFELEPRRATPATRSASSPGRPRRGRCRPTSPSLSGPTSTTRWCEEDGHRYLLAEARLGRYERELSRADPGRRR